VNDPGHGSAPAPRSASEESGDRLLFSIVTVCLDAARTLEACIDSVAGQTCREFEHLVIDGDSSDGTREVLARHEAALACIVSEPDRGIADAMNKGLARCRGEYVLFLNADDRLADPEVLARTAQRIRSHPGYAIHAHGVLVEKAGRSRHVRPRGFNPWMRFKTGIPHQGAFCHRTLFERVGRFDTRYAVAMDYDLFLRAYLAGLDARVSDDVTATMGDGGISSRRDATSLRKRFGEEMVIHFRSTRSPVVIAGYCVYWPLYIGYALVRYLLVPHLTRFGR